MNGRNHKALVFNLSSWCATGFRVLFLDYLSKSSKQQFFFTWTLNRHYINFIGSFCRTVKLSISRFKNAFLCNKTPFSFFLVVFFVLWELFFNFFSTTKFSNFLTLFLLEWLFSSLCQSVSQIMKTGFNHKSSIKKTFFSRFFSNIYFHIIKR